MAQGLWQMVQWSMVEAIGDSAIFKGNIQD
jgi:hypothetical protein